MKVSELKEKTVSELETILIDLRKSQFELRMQLATGQLSKNHMVKVTRRDVARVKTIINEKKVGASS